ncbi:uncharacterized protein FOMMEDRAFT_95074, partial [Fomitiporia mediterranea MF3/22]|uniref:uncharacterized protein n=1 Tax=Fomitiporia mediterranea (strain MF3/22) TaxID=694068 RepID=UPI0004408963
PARLKKQRSSKGRERVRIELAPDQPPTTQGKPRERVYVACQQCRSRKIRCDGAKPMCHNCKQRGTGICEFDSIPKRRGPDRQPGARQRHGKVPAPRTRRRAQSDNKQESPQPTRGTPYSSDHPERDVGAPPLNDQNATWAHLPSPPSSASPHANRLAFEHLAPGSSGSSASEAQYDYNNMNIQPFAYNAPPNSYVESSLGSESNQRVLLPRISTGSHIHASTASLSDSFSPDTCTPVSYSFSITQTPSLDFVRKTWWDSLLDTYCSETYCTPAIATRYQSAYGLSVTIPRGTYASGLARQQVAQIIVRDLQSLFKDSIFWFAFVNVPLFFGTFFRARETMQPALILAVLMFSNYLRSSAVELGSEGMMRTNWLRDKAHAALDASVNASWIDPGLAQAAWLLALFELSSQPMRSVPRLHSAISTLDNIIRSLALTFIDFQDPSVSVPTDSAETGFCSSITSNGHLLQYHSSPSPRTVVDALNRSLSNARSPSEQPSCICNELSLGYNWSEAKEHVPFWLNSPAWNPSWTDAEIRREECRRLCWNTLHLFAGYTTYRTSLGLATLDLFLLHPSNVHNIFPGENLADLLPPSSRALRFDTVWALYARAILLWHACLRIRNVSDRERAVFAQSVWLEADAIENALDGHTCNTERAFLYHGREYLFNARMYVSSEFRRFVPHPSPEMSGAVHRRKAEEWLTHQATIAKRSMQGLQALTGVRGTVLARRPFFCFWFMGHVSRCLQLWQVDKTLTVALELAKHFLAPINYLSALWPCDGEIRITRNMRPFVAFSDQRMQYAGIRRQLEDACREAGVALPPPIDPTFPLPPSLTGLL